MINKNTVAREVLDKLDQLIGLEEKRSVLDDEIESSEKRVVRLNLDYRKAMIEIEGVYNMIIDVYSLDKKIKYDSGRTPGLATFSFGDFELFYTTYRIEDGKTICNLTQKGAEFAQLSDEELLNNAAIQYRKKITKERIQIMKLEVERSKKEYELATLLAQLSNTQSLQLMTKISLKSKIKEAKKSLAIIESELSAIESKMSSLMENGEKKLIQEANEIQYLIKAAIELKENREPIKYMLEEAIEKLNDLKEGRATCLDDQEKIIRDIISKPVNIEALENIVNVSVPNSSYSEISKVVLKLAALQAKNKRK